MVAKVTAKKPSTLTSIGEVSEAAANSAPTSVIPETALVPDINGVCKVGGIQTYYSNSFRSNVAHPDGSGKMISRSSCGRPRRSLQPVVWSSKGLVEEEEEKEGDKELDEEEEEAVRKNFE